MIYHVRNWHRYQRDFIARALKQRRRRAIQAFLETGELPDRLDGPHPMTYLRVDVNIDAEVDALAGLGLGDRAEGILLRLLRHVARTDALRGEVQSPSAAPRKAVGRLWGGIFGASPEFALKAVDALVERRILVEGPVSLPPWLRALTDMETLRDEAERTASRAGTRTPTGTGMRTASRRGAHARASGEELSSYPPRNGEPPREAVAPPSALAAGRSAAHGLEDEHRPGDPADAPTGTSRRLSIPARRRMLGMTGGNFHDVVAAWEALSPQERERLVREDDLALAAEEFEA